MLTPFSTISPPSSIHNRIEDLLFIRLVLSELSFRSLLLVIDISGRSKAVCHFQLLVAATRHKTVAVSCTGEHQRHSASDACHKDVPSRFCVSRKAQSPPEPLILPPAMQPVPPDQVRRDYLQ